MGPACIAPSLADWPVCGQINHGPSRQAGILPFTLAAGFLDGAGITMMPDRFPARRVSTDHLSEDINVRGSILRGVYFCFCFVPMFLAYAATLVDPTTFTALLEQDSQLVLPILILRHTPVFAQIVFFGAVLSAVMSCASATLLAPSVMLSENVIKGRCLISATGASSAHAAGCRGLCRSVLTIAPTPSSSIYMLVVNTHKVTLVQPSFPLCRALWSRATTQGP
jgi:Na+/proline symporter